ncbi:hypothetical protein DS909_14455 [Phaeobacter gallaeciensis]|uniref:Uncharacterized protein n=1 Tax=Phaeobacter gallaeciensis TaxID=60890 RepID=A0A366WY50_9RHOB|nr:hypothetical protein DS909_14455 [Phaeobacter gallaeciensis]
MNAEFVSIQAIGVDETIILTADLREKSLGQGYVQICTVWRVGKPKWSANTPSGAFPEFGEKRSIAFIGIMSNIPTDECKYSR